MCGWGVGGEKAQRGEVSCSRSHSHEVAETGCELRQCGSYSVHCSHDLVASLATWLDKQNLRLHPSIVESECAF